MGLWDKPVKSSHASWHADVRTANSKTVYLVSPN